VEDFAMIVLSRSKNAAVRIGCGSLSFSHRSAECGTR